MHHRKVFLVYENGDGKLWNTVLSCKEIHPLNETVSGWGLGDIYRARIRVPVCELMQALCINMVH
jgi:hypothetical protein